MAKDSKVSPEARWAIVGVISLVYVGAWWGGYQIDNLEQSHPAYLQDMYKDVRTVSADNIDSANEDKVVLVQGRLTGTKELEDPTFGVKVRGISLSRGVEVYGFNETSKYRTLTWTGGSASHKNKFESTKVSASPLNLGAFEIGSDLIWLDESVTKTIKINLPPPNASLPASKIAPLKSDGEGNYWTATGDKPNEGDERISLEYEVLRDTDVTVIGKQNGNTLHPYGESNEFHIAAGKLSVADFVKGDQSFATGFYSSLRVLCFFGLSISAAAMMFVMPLKLPIWMRVLAVVLVTALPYAINLMVLGK